MMKHEHVSSTQAFTFAVPAPRIAQATNAVEVVRAESELAAIDELMADLTDEFAAEAKW